MRSLFSIPSGTIWKIHILPNGKFREEVLIQSSMYSCTITVFASEHGRVLVNGSILTFDGQGGKLTSRDNCRARFNYEKSVEARQLRKAWDFRPGGAEPQLCLSDNCKPPVCYRRDAN